MLPVLPWKWCARGHCQANTDLVQEYCKSIRNIHVLNKTNLGAAILIFSLQVLCPRSSLRLCSKSRLAQEAVPGSLSATPGRRSPPRHSPRGRPCRR